VTPHQAALAAQAAGISVLPPKQDGSKRPDSNSWAHLQREPATVEQINKWYANGRTGTGWVTGRVSGGLEVMDFDDRGALAEFKKLCADAELDGLLACIMEGYFEHTPNGAHIAYRCKTIDGNKKLAKNKHNKAMIETRGEGGFIIVAPTHGSVNTAGEYVLESGGVDTIVEIMPEDRDALHTVARMLDESIAPKETTPTTARGGRPGDDYNDRVPWADVLQPHGWVRTSSRLGVTHWRRPGKDKGAPSATTNHGDSDLLYVFSTSTAFESERGYSKFSAYSILEHGGDHKAAAKELALLGYGQQIEVPDKEVDLSGILSRYDTKEPTKPKLDDLLRVPGLVGELAEWINESSIKAQPVLALGASIAAMATIIGRKVQTQTGLRSNIYVLGVGETGCGKERARQAIRALFCGLKLEGMVGTNWASDSAVETAVIDNPACLYLVDEMGLFLKAIKEERSPAYIQATMRVLLNMYGESEGFYRRRTYADKKRNEGDATIDQPCLSIYGTTVADNLYESLTKEHAANGFLSRLLVFESQDPDPYPRWPDKALRAVPASVHEGFEAWKNASIDPYTKGNLTEHGSPNPLVVEATKEARSVFDALEGHMRACRASVRKVGDDPGPYTRIVATAQKLALIRACGIHEHPEITEADARWGCDLAWLLAERFLRRVGELVTENKIEALVNRVYGLIRDAGNGGMRHNQLTRKTQWLTRASRADIIASLVEAGRIEASGSKPTTYSVP
jgi:hypothetical protein